MYRKYIQELSATSASPDPDFPDTNLIVGDAQLKAAKAGTVHRDKSLLATTTTTTTTSTITTTMTASPSSAGPSDIRTTVSDSPPAQCGGDSDLDSDTSSVSLSVKSESAVVSVGRASVGSVQSARNVYRGREQLNHSRRHSEIFHLQDIFSCNNTPEFRRRPFSHTYAHSAVRASPPRVSEDDRFPTLPNEEVIMVRPVTEASRARSPLYPAPQGDLLLNHRSSPSLVRGVIRVLSAPNADGEAEETTGLNFSGGPGGVTPSSSHHLNNTSNKDNDPWLRPPPRTPASPPQSARRHSAGPSLYSVLCCRVFTGSR